MQIKKLHPHAPQVAEIGLLLLFAWWAFTMLQDNTDSELSTAAVIENHAKITPPSLESLSTVPLFGKLEATPAVAVAAPPRITRRSFLDMKLLGTVVAGERSAAVMTVGTSAETTFFLGDMLYGRAYLKKVEADAVVVSDQGNDKRIALSEGDAKKAGSRVEPPSVITQNTPSDIPEKFIPSDQGAAYPETAPGMTNQGLPPGMTNQMLPPGMTNQGLPPGMTNQGLPPGVTNQMLPPGMTNQGLPPGMTNQGLPPGVTNQMLPPGMTNQMLPPGMTNQGLPPGVTNQMLPPGVTNQMLPPGMTNQMLPPGMTNQMLPPGMTNQSEPLTR